MKHLDLLLADEVVARLRVGRFHGPRLEGSLKPCPAFGAIRSLHADLERVQEQWAADEGLDAVESERLSAHLWELREREQGLALCVRDEHGRRFAVDELRFHGRAFELCLTADRTTEPPSLPLSERARRMLARGTRSALPFPLDAARAQGMADMDAFTQLALHWAGREYGVRGGGGFEFEARPGPPTHDEAGRQLLPLGRHGGIWLPFWIADDGRVCCGDAPASSITYADSISEMVEADALLDELLDAAPRWSLFGGPPIPMAAPLRDAVGQLAARLGATHVEAASGSARDAWRGADLLLLLGPSGGPGPEPRRALQVHARDPSTAVRAAADLLRHGLPLFEPIRPHPLALRTLLPVDLDRELAGHGALADRLDVDARGFLGALRAGIARALHSPAADASSARLPELLHAVEVALAFEVDPASDADRAARRDRLARLLAFWSEHDATLEACVTTVVRRRTQGPDRTPGGTG